MERLSYIDEHAISVDASASETWSALLRVLCRDPADPSTVQVGKLEEATPQQRLAVTWAAFPGVRGKLFRALAIGAGAHRFVVRRMLKQIAEAAHSRRAAVR